jgi:hypothetical protein
VPEIITVVAVVTGFVVMLKLTLFAFFGTVTLGGTVADALFESKVTSSPLEGALPESVNVQVNVVPPVADVELNPTITIGELGKSTIVADVVMLPAVAVIFTAVVAATWEVVILRLWLEIPEVKLAVAGTTADLLLEESFTT